MKLHPTPDTQAIPMNRRGTKSFRAFAAYGMAYTDGPNRADRLLMHASARRVARASKLARQQFEDLARPAPPAPPRSRLARMEAAQAGCCYDDRAPC